MQCLRESPHYIGVCIQVTIYLATSNEQHGVAPRRREIRERERETIPGAVMRDKRGGGETVGEGYGWWESEQCSRGSRMQIFN